MKNAIVLLLLVVSVLVANVLRLERRITKMEVSMGDLETSVSEHSYVLDMQRCSKSSRI